MSVSHSEIFLQLLSSNNNSKDDNNNNEKKNSIQAYICLIIFFIDIICIITSPSIPIFPKFSFLKKLGLYLKAKLLKNRRIENVQQSLEERVEENNFPTIEFYKLPLDMTFSSILSLILLFLFQTLSLNDLKIGLLGSETQNLKPYSILLLFMSLSYLCVSLDLSGVFQYIANFIIIKSKQRGHVLFLGFSLFSSLLTIFTSNDIVILTLTPICCYLCKFSKNLNPVPFIMSQFFLANVWSVLLIIGNPTNLIVALSYNLNFIGYLKWMAFPAISSGLTCFVLLYVLFYSDIPKFIETSSSTTLNNQQQQQLLNNTITIELNEEIVDHNSTNLVVENNEEENKELPIHHINNETIDNINVESNGDDSNNPFSIHLEKKSAIFKTILLLLCLLVLSVSSVIPLNSIIPNFSSNNEATLPPEIVTCFFFLICFIYDLIIDILQIVKKYNENNKKISKIMFIDLCIWRVTKRLPWSIVPFIISMFTIVQLLNVYGWTDLLSKKIAELIVSFASIGQSQNSLLLELLSSTLVMSFLSSFACNVINNQPMSILFSTIISNKNYKALLTPLQRKASMFALILGSNFGANITLFGALAGIMFISIVRQNGVTNKQLNYFTFLKIGMIVTPFVILVGGFSIFVEMYLLSSEESI